MTYKISLGKDYAEEYRKRSENIIAQTQQTLRKAGVRTFDYYPENQNTEISTDAWRIEHQKNNNNTNNKKTNNNHSDIPFSNNKTTNNFRNSNGIANTVYRTGIGANNKASNNKDKTTTQGLNEFVSTIENADGKDDNDDIVDFMETEFQEGYHTNCGGYIYYENGENSSKNAVSANVIGSYKTKNKKFSMLYSGSYEYSKEKIPQNNTDNSTSESLNKNGNALLMAKYKADKFTYAGGATTNIYGNNTELYNIYAGISDNHSNFGTTFRRQIQVSRNDAGERVFEKKTSVKINILQPKTAGDFPNAVPDIPTVEEISDFNNKVNNAKQNVNNLVSDDWQKGFSFDLDMSTSSGSDEYGVIGKYATYFTKKESNQPYLSAKAFLGLYDYHPDTQEGIKIWTGAKCDLNITTGNNVNISSTAIVSNSRIMQGSSGPINTFMSVLDTTVSKNKWSGSLSAGYINTNSSAKYSFLTGEVEYKIKNSSFAFKGGYQDYKIFGDGEMAENKNRIFHVGASYKLRF